ncbi:MAG: OmpA family protein [Gemmatimonadaceae bacterium]|nr:OmpA family protein [Gemmatimonadaceae bacterium]
MCRGVAALALVTVMLPERAEAQGGLLGRVKRRVEDNVGRQAERAVDCVMGDQTCINKAKAEGKPVRIDSTGASGAAGAAGAAGSATVVSGGGGTGAGASTVWTNYDFVPGTKTFFYEDFRNDAVGNFPRRYEFVNGNVELVTYRDRTWLRFETTGKMYIPLPSVLPERYTIEMDFWGTGGACWIYPSGTLSGEYRLEFGADAYGAVVTPGGTASSRLGSDQRELIHQGRVTMDGSYAKVYVNARRVANVPNFNSERANRIGFYCDGGMAVGPIRIAEGGRKLYEALAADGRVATQGIYFDTGSDQIRPESTPTLKEIAAMVAEHEGLRLGIEGHTDNVGAPAANLDLSKRRAAAVKAYLVSTLNVDASRLEATGLGSTKPAQPNTTPEGRQTNRRVELVKLP